MQWSGDDEGVTAGQVGCPMRWEGLLECGYWAGLLPDAVGGSAWIVGTGRINQTERTRRWGRVGESESERQWAGPRLCHGCVAICRSSNA